MVNIYPFIRKSTKKNNDYVFVRFRVMLGRAGDLYYASNILVRSENWDEKRRGLNPKTYADPIECRKIENAIIERKQQLLSVFETLVKNGIKPTTTALKEAMLNLPDHATPVVTQEENERKVFFDRFDEYAQKNRVSEVRKKSYKVMRRNLEKFEQYMRCSKPNFHLSVTGFSVENAMDFEYFLLNEHVFAKQHPELYKGEREAKQRSKNTTAQRIKVIRAFFNWLVRMEKIERSPFANIPAPSEVYGTPFYLTINERNQVYKYNLSRYSLKLKQQRDIFVFHCVVGCRISDFLKLKKSNVINGAIEYIAGKTKDGDPKTIRVPLNKIGLRILNKYKKFEGEKLLPFIPERKYNMAIREVLKIAGVNRVITIVDSKTREAIQKPMYEVGSSHLARRTLYANVYKKFKDPALAGSLTGHSPNSRAAQRYRDIDEEMKIELVKSLE